MATDIVLENVVIRYPHLDAPWTGKPSIEADYQCRLILPQDFSQWEQVQACVNEAIANKFGANPPASLKMPWLDQYLQPSLEKDGPYVGCYYMSPKGKGTKPGVVDQNSQVIPDLQIKTKIFSGCIVNAYVNFYGYQVASTGVAIALQGIQLVNDQVERLADGSRDVTQVFKPLAGAPPATAAPSQSKPPWVN